MYFTFYPLLSVEQVVFLSLILMRANIALHVCWHVPLCGSDRQLKLKSLRFFKSLR